MDFHGKFGILIFLTYLVQQSFENMTMLRFDDSFE